MNDTIRAHLRIPIGRALAADAAERQTIAAGLDELAARNTPPTTSRRLNSTAGRRGAPHVRLELKLTPTEAAGLRTLANVLSLGLDGKKPALAVVLRLGLCKLVPLVTAAISDPAAMKALVSELLIARNEQAKPQTTAIDLGAVKGPTHDEA